MSLVLTDPSEIGCSSFIFKHAPVVVKKLLILCAREIVRAESH